MHDHILKAVLSQGSSALGRFVRLWLLALACVAGFIGFVVMHDATIAERIIGGLLFAWLAAIPAAIVVAVAIVAIKF